MPLKIKLFKLKMNDFNCRKQNLEKWMNLEEFQVGHTFTNIYCFYFFKLTFYRLNFFLSLHFFDC